MYDSIRIERGRKGFTVRTSDPEIEKANRERERGKDGPVGEWRDPCVEYTFDTKEQMLAFVDKAVDIALPEDEFSSVFDKLAKEAQGS